MHFLVPRNKILIGILLLLTAQMVSLAQEYSTWFTDAEMRVDLSHSGDVKTENYFVEQFYQQPTWAGAKQYLIDTSGYGDNYFEVLDSASQTLLYSKGYNNLFYEWQETDEAKITSRSFEEVIRFPFPKSTVQLKIYKRLKNCSLLVLHQFYVNPKSYRIDKSKKQTFPTKQLYGSLPVNKAVDVVFLAEGYTVDEMDDFEKDAKKFADFLFKTKPFDSVKEKFNIWLVYSESEHSGTDIPGEEIWVNTIVNTHFYTFGSERYLTSQSIKKIHDLASLVPYDQVYVLVNSEKYGGGGIFNYYSLTSTKHIMSPWVFIHEFGHGFAGLADEYYDSYVAYESIYDLETEPWRPNITTLVDPQKKWKSMVHKKTPIPTPATEKYKSKVGFFEGGGYVEKGIYRPYQNCEMKSLQSGFCPVCQKSILQMVQWTTDQ